jgi:uncharacterized protein YdaU (DUF1376 family)
MKTPAFLWYPKDILTSSRVQEMSLAEEGAYRRLLDYCWLNGSVPSDEKRCARLIGKGATPEMAKYVLDMFLPHPTDPDKKIHDRLEVERAKQESNSKARKFAAEARWDKRGKPADVRGKQVISELGANAMQMHTESDANALQTECFAIAITERKEEEVKEEETHPPGRPFAYLIGDVGFNDLPVYVSKHYPQAVQRLREKYSELGFTNAITAFADRSIEKQWIDKDDFRTHFVDYVRVFVSHNPDSKTRLMTAPQLIEADYQSLKKPEYR